MRAKRKRKNMQWHPPLYAGFQIELETESWNLEFENEHQLSMKPLAIDILIIKKNVNVPIQKNIGKLFRKHNIVEYKSPGDYLSIDDFYKVYAYACLYKALTDRVDEIKISEITVTFVCQKYPRKLVSHLKTCCNCEITIQGDGIYTISGDRFAMQIILTSKLSVFENLWLWGMNNTIRDKEIKEKLVSEYIQHKGMQNYESVMDLIIRTNKDMFKEEEGMCEALEELFEERYAEKLKKEVAEKVKEEVVVREQTAIVNAKAEAIFELLEDYGMLPKDLREKILREKDLSVLKKWHKTAAKVNSIEKFEEAI